jgi:hypothetical protein
MFCNLFHKNKYALNIKAIFVKFYANDLEILLLRETTAFEINF